MKITREMYAGETDPYTDLLNITLQSLAPEFRGFRLEPSINDLLRQGYSRHGAVGIVRNVLERELKRLEVTHG